MRDETLLRFPGLLRLLSSPVVLSDRLLDRMEAGADDMYDIAGRTRTSDYVNAKSGNDRRGVRQ